MKVLLVIAAAGFIFWMYWSALRDIYLAFKGRRMKSSLKKLAKEAVSDEADAIIKAGKKRDLNRFGELIKGASPDTLRELSILDFQSPLIKKLAQQNQNNPRARFLYGNSLIEEAWRVRGGAAGNKVSAKKGQTFFDLLRDAELELLRSYEMDRDFTGVYAPLIRAEMGSSNREKAQQVYNDGRRTAPDQLDYHLTMLTLLTEKWQGLEGEMFQFARENSERVTSGELNGLIPAAHFEYWLELEDKEDEEYFLKPEVQEEIQKAYEGMKDLVKVQAKGQGFMERHQHHLALNYFAAVFHFMGDNKTARSIFEEIGGNHTYRPWANLGMHHEVAFMNYRNKVMKGK